VQMDWELGRPISSVYSEDVPMLDSLLQTITEEVRLQELRTISLYLEEIQQLESQLNTYRRVWKEVIYVADKVIQAIASIEKSRTRFRSRVKRAEKEWLAYWGIYKECIKQQSHPIWL